MPRHIQQLFPLPKIIEEKEETQTQAESTIDLSNQGFVTPVVNKFAEMPQILQKQQTIAANLSSNTFNADKILKAVSSIMKILKAYNLNSKIPASDKISGEIGQVRRLLRIDRSMMVIKWFTGCCRKEQINVTDKCMMIFKFMMLVEDLSDLLSYLIQLKVIQKDHLLVRLRKTVANLYFLECMGWLIYHLRQYIRAKNEEDKEKNKMAIIKYVLDGLIAHNEFIFKAFSIKPKTASAMSFASAFLSLYLVWK